MGKRNYLECGVFGSMKETIAGTLMVNAYFLEEPITSPVSGSRR
ncbi:MAG: hypothetical protein DDT19_02641 [Syntrophomonadaceae bacterium]|nr:hypothetical protein [Bacillota bacterium]